jgi:hypothetical protein
VGSTGHRAEASGLRQGQDEVNRGIVAIPVALQECGTSAGFRRRCRYLPAVGSAGPANAAVLRPHRGRSVPLGVSAHGDGLDPQKGPEQFVVMESATGRWPLTRRERSAAWGCYVATAGLLQRSVQQRRLPCQIQQLAVGREGGLQQNCRFTATQQHMLKLWRATNRTPNECVRQDAAHGSR